MSLWCSRTLLYTIHFFFRHEKMLKNEMDFTQEQEDLWRPNNNLHLKPYQARLWICFFSNELYFISLNSLSTNSTFLLFCFVEAVCGWQGQKNNFFQNNFRIIKFTTIKRLFLMFFETPYQDISFRMLLNWEPFVSQNKSGDTFTCTCSRFREREREREREMLASG